MLVRQLIEMPQLNSGELPYAALTKISKEALERDYEHFGSVEAFDIHAKNSGGFIVGSPVEDSFYIFLSIRTRKQAFPVEPTGLKDYQQVSFVQVVEGFEREGRAAAAYTAIAKTVDLVSDNEQYLPAKKLWQSLARNGDVPIYVFAKGEYTRYDGKNIDEKEIWGKSIEFKNVLLVATAKKVT